jgi:hypothetical protein
VGFYTGGVVPFAFDEFWTILDCSSAADGGVTGALVEDDSPPRRP